MPDQSWAEKLGQLLYRRRKWMSGLWALEARLKGARIGREVLFFGRPVISILGRSSLQIGDGVRIDSTLRTNPLGCFQPSILRTLCPGAEITLGEHVGISGTVICAAKSIRIGEGTIIGSGAMIIDTDFHEPAAGWRWNNDMAKSAKPVTIGRGAFIGARAIVLKGVTIGDRAVVGAGAVVAKDVPAGHIAIGNPARVMPWSGTPASE